MVVIERERSAVATFPPYPAHADFAAVVWRTCFAAQPAHLRLAWTHTHLAGAQQQSAPGLGGCLKDCQALACHLAWPGSMQVWPESSFGQCRRTHAVAVPTAPPAGSCPPSRFPSEAASLHLHTGFIQTLARSRLVLEGTCGSRANGGAASAQVPAPAGQGPPGHKA